MAEERLVAMTSASNNHDSGVRLLKDFRKFVVMLVSDNDNGNKVERVQEFVKRYIALKGVGKINCGDVRNYLGGMNDTDRGNMYRLLACLNRLSSVEENQRLPTLVQTSNTLLKNVVMRKGANTVSHE